MSIWDYFSGNATPEQNAGLLGLATAFNGALGDGRRPVNLGQALAAGAAGMQQGHDQFTDREREKQMLAMQEKLMGYKMQDAESDLKNQEAARQRAEQLRQFYISRGAGERPAMGGSVAPAAPAATGTAPAPAQASAAAGGNRGIYQQRLAEAQELRSAGFGPEADAAEAAALKFQPKVSGWKEVQVDGKVLYAPYFEDGTPGQPVPLEVAKQLEKINTGGKTELVNPYTGSTVRSMTNTMTPDAVASNALGWANNRATLRGQDMTDRRVREGLALQAQKEKAPTEFQGKSAAFGARAAEADKIISGLTGQYSPARVNAKMSAQDIPLVGGITGAVANKFLSDSEQQAEQAQRDFINAVLRQESGAAIGESEFTNARRQYFPQPGDTTATLSQKARNRALAVQGLNNNAGRAAFTPAPAAGAGSGWSIKKVGP